MSEKRNNESMAILGQRMVSGSYRSMEQSMKAGNPSAVKFYQRQQARDHRKMFEYLLRAIDLPRIDAIDDDNYNR